MPPPPARRRRGVCPLGEVGGGGRCPLRWGGRQFRAGELCQSPWECILFFKICPEPGGNFGSGSLLPREFVEGVCCLNSEMNVEEGTQN